MGKDKFQKKLMILNLSLGITSLFAQTNEACGKRLAGEKAEIHLFSVSEMEHFFVMSNT